MNAVHDGGRVERRRDRQRRRIPPTSWRPSIATISLRVAVLALGPRDASLVDLQMRHGLTPAEIADELGVTPNAAHQQLFRMRERLGNAVGFAAVVATGSTGVRAAGRSARRCPPRSTRRCSA